MEKALSLFRNCKIKNKLMLMVMFVTTITVIMTFVVFIAYDIFTVRQAMVKELSLLSDVIGKRTVPALEFSKAEKAYDNLTDLKSKPSVLLACLYTKDNIKLTEFHQGKGVFKCPEKPEKGYYFKDRYLMLSKDIRSSEGVYSGSIYLLSDMSEITEHLIQFGFSMAGLMIIAILVAYRIAHSVQKVISVPIDTLINAARSVHADGQYSVRVKAYYNDEIGVLAETFNDMLSEVQQRDRELKDINENLEHMVEERTHDLEVAKVRAEAANDAKSEFLRNMSHEFRTPLHGMRSFSDFGINEAETADRDNLKSYFLNISKVTDRLTTLVEGILNIAQMESGTQEFLLENCDLSEIFESVIAEQSALLQKKGINLSYNKPTFSTSIVCSRSKIVQVIANLMGNAIKFTPSGKNITLSARREENDPIPSMYIYVSDEGVGVPEEERESIFKKFIQSTRTKTNAGGTGLGLTICTGIVHGHGGRIWVENNKDVGATFTFTIPLNLSAGTKLIQTDTL